MVARRSSGWLRTWGRIGAWALEIGSSGAVKLGERFLAEDDDPSMPQVVVISCGPLSQIWVRDVDHRLTRAEIGQLAPGFLQALVEHPAVELVIVRQGRDVEVLGHAGTVRLHAETGQALDRKGENPLGVYEEPEVAAAQIAAYARMDACGDVICFGASFRPETLREATPGAVDEPHVYTFEHQLGTHASLGGDQAYPFILLPADVPFDPAPIIRAADMYPFLKSLLPEAASPAPPADGPQRSQVGDAAPVESQPATRFRRGMVVGLPDENAAPPANPGTIQEHD